MNEKTHDHIVEDTRSELDRARDLLMAGKQGLTDAQVLPHMDYSVNCPACNEFLIIRSAIIILSKGGGKNNGRNTNEHDNRAHSGGPGSQGPESGGPGGGRPGDCGHRQGIHDGSEAQPVEGNLHGLRGPGIPPGAPAACQGRGGDIPPGLEDRTEDRTEEKVSSAEELQKSVQKIGARAMTLEPPFPPSLNDQEWERVLLDKLDTDLRSYVNKYSPTAGLQSVLFSITNILENSRLKGNNK